MSMIPVSERSAALAAAIAVYEASEWPAAPLEYLPHLPVPTGKERATALKGLPRNYLAVWQDGKVIRAEFVIEGVDAARFALWLVAVGLPASKIHHTLLSMMIRKAPEEDEATILRVFEELMVRRGQADVLTFVERFMVRQSRWGEHDMSGWGATAMTLLERTGAPWPANRELYHDWAIWMFEEVHPEPHPRKFYRTRKHLLVKPNGVHPADEVEARLHAAIEAGAPPTGPLGRLPGPLVERGLLSREAAIEACLHGLRVAIRQGDVAAWALALAEDLELTDDEIEAHADQLAVVLSRGVPAFQREFGPWFLEKGPEHLLTEAAMSALSAKARSTRVAALKNLAKRPAPSNADEVAVLIEDARAVDPHPSIDKAADAVLTAWGVPA